jgi:hypothetical protein
MPSEQKTEEFEEELSSEGHASGIEHEPETQENLEITEPFNPTDIDIKTKNPSIDSLMKRLEHKEINLTPDFQRKGGIWKVEQKSRLIESLLLNIPLPVFYVAADKNEQWLVVDGLQRMTTLDQFIRAQSFSLKNLEFLKDFEGKKYDDLPRPMKRRILEAEPVFHIIQPGTPKDVTRTIFKRINTGGLPLSHQEIRHALYQGHSTRFLQELADGAAFKTVTDNSIRDDRMADREFVLRYLAFNINGIDAYKNNDLDNFLSKTMEYLNQTLKTDDSLTIRYRTDFERTMNIAYQIFGNEAFRKPSSVRRAPINKALFETWAVELGRCNDEQVKLLIQHGHQLKKKFLMLFEQDWDFRNAISQTTAMVSSVHLRFSRVRELIEQTLQEDLA